MQYAEDISDQLPPTSAPTSCEDLEDDVAQQLYGGGTTCGNSIANDLCESLHCPTCGLAHMCDVSCGYCDAVSVETLAPTLGTPWGWWTQNTRMTDDHGLDWRVFAIQEVDCPGGYGLDETSILGPIFQVAMVPASMVCVRVCVWAKKFHRSGFISASDSFNSFIHSFIRSLF